MEISVKNSFAFEFKTYVDSPEIWCANNGVTFSNEIKMLKDGTKVGTEPIHSNISDDATIGASNNVLKKEHVKYDPISKKFTWKLTVNTNNTNLGNVEITDKLEGILTCNILDAKLNGGEFADGNSFTVDKSTNTIKN